jgi:hypothetical protein
MDLLRTVIGLIGLLLLIPFAAPAFAQTVLIDPSEGISTDVFTVQGCGFAPGTAIEDSYISPDGEIFEVFQNGEPTILVADEDGCVLDTVIPAEDFVGSREGIWQFWFCVGGTSTCWVTDITIRPYTEPVRPEPTEEGMSKELG